MHVCFFVPIIFRFLLLTFVFLYLTNIGQIKYPMNTNIKKKFNRIYGNIFYAFLYNNLHFYSKILLKIKTRNIPFLNLLN